MLSRLPSSLCPLCNLNNCGLLLTLKKPPQKNHFILWIRACNIFENFLLVAHQSSQFSEWFSVTGIIAAYTSSWPRVQDKHRKMDTDIKWDPPMRDCSSSSWMANIKHWVSLINMITLVTEVIYYSPFNLQLKVPNIFSSCASIAHMVWK